MVLTSEKKKRTMVQQASSSYENLTFPLDMLPDELQNKILFHLPTDNAVRLKTVRKDWQSGVEAWASGTPMDFTPQPQKPFYFMFNSEVDSPGTCAYNSNQGKWVGFEIRNSDQEETDAPLGLPRFSETSFQISASGGLVCLMDAKNQEKIYVCNPIFKNRIKLLPKAPGALSDYCAITIATDVHSRKYVVAMVRSSRVCIDDYRFTQNMTIQLYKSETHSWVDLHNENSIGWQGSDHCVICKDTLYSVVQLHYVWGETRPHHAIVAYNLAQGKQKQSLARTMVLAPCALTCVRLLNLNDKLIMVGGIQQQGRMELGGISIWEMCGNRWREITRTADDLIRRFCNAIDDTFLCSGCGNLVFIQAYTSRTVLTYEFGNGKWEFLTKSTLPLVADDESNYFNGFCFEPRLDILP